MKSGMHCMGNKLEVSWRASSDERMEGNSHVHSSHVVALRWYPHLGRCWADEQSSAHTAVHVIAMVGETEARYTHTEHNHPTLLAAQRPRPVCQVGLTASQLGHFEDIDIDLPASS